ncbi:MAG: hypothetical protein R3C59_23395 [Planctomycetaceae bacterium]
MSKEADPVEVAQIVKAHEHYHGWDDTRVAEVIASQMDYFSQDFLRTTFGKCGISGHRAYEALGKLLNAGLVEVDSNTGTVLTSFRMPRATQEEVRRRLNQDPEPELTNVSAALADVVSKLPEGAYRAFGQETLTCLAARAYRSAVVMAWNLAIDYLISWILSDSARLDMLNAAWIQEWKDKKAGIHNAPLSNREELNALKEAVVVRITRKAALVDKANSDLLEEALRKRNQAAHPSAQISFEAPTAAGHVHALVTFVVRHPLTTDTPEDGRSKQLRHSSKDKR